jgi:hypothetical protein
MNITDYLKEEKNVKLLEKIDTELKNIIKSEGKLDFVLPMIFVIIERLRDSDTPFPSIMFKKPKKLKKTKK